MSPRLGVYGGTFNPIHLGHLRAAEEVAEALGLGQVLFVPSARPPHKGSEADEIAPAELRLAWTRAAVEDNPRFRVDPIEAERQGPSYLVDTLRTIGERTAPERPVFIVGHDAFVEMGDWREPREIFRLADVAVMSRPPVDRGSLADWLPECVRGDFELAPGGDSARHRDAGSRIDRLEITALDISASDIRNRLREGRSTRYLLPEAVRLAIERSGCFAPRVGSSSEVLQRPLQREGAS